MIKWRASFKSLTSVTSLFTWSPTHRQNSSKSYWCLSWGLWKKNEFALCDVPSLIKSVLIFQVLISVMPNLRNAHTYHSHTHRALHVYSSPPDTRDVRISMRNIFPFKWYTRYFLPQTTSQWLKIYEIFKYFAFHIESICKVCVLGIYTT